MKKLRNEEKLLNSNNNLYKLNGFVPEIFSSFAWTTFLFVNLWVHQSEK